MASLTRWKWVSWTLRVGDGQGGLACCDSWGHKESDTTEQLIWSDLIWLYYFPKISFWSFNIMTHFLYPPKPWVVVVVVQSLNCIQLYVTQWTAVFQAFLSITISQSLLKLMSIMSMPSNHPLWPPSPPSFSLFQHQGLFQWVSSLYQLAKVLELRLQHHSFQWIVRVYFLKDWLVTSCCPGDSQESSAAPQCKSISSSLWSNSTSLWFTTIWKHSKAPGI